MKRYYYNNWLAKVLLAFTSLNELQDFYLGGMNWIQSCYQSGWIKNETFDYKPYEEALAAL